jgi:phytoene dehydrogenase-like protein
MTYDVVIIGAGMSGLAAGIRLAYFDKKVCILEKHSRIGGLNSYYSKGGYKFDVGLHALTNYVDKSERKKPLMQLLRQLRIRYDELNLCPQIRSAIKFDDNAIYFTNDFKVLESEIADKFPSQIDGFLKLLAYVNDYDAFNMDSSEFLSSRKVLGSFLSDKLLIDMLLCPLMFYGGAKEKDMDFWQLVIMFRSMFLEGLSRPYDGVRRILNILKSKFLEYGGELFLKKGVNKIISESSGNLRIELEKGEIINAKKVISSAGYLETMRLCEGINIPDKTSPGKMSFMESVYLLNKKPSELGINDTITFYNSGDRFDYKRPDKLIDEKSGVICCPNNFMYEIPFDDNAIRVTNISNSDLWSMDDKDKYDKQKEECMDLTLNEVKKYIGDFKDSVIFTDSFTPKTIERYTGHINGAVYGNEEKIRNGRTGIENLFVCGTDQGFLGITGAMLSGITIANLYVLK